MHFMFNKNIIMYQGSSNHNSNISNTRNSIIKKQRVALKMVPSSFEPPQQTHASYQKMTDLRSESTNHDFLTYRDDHEEIFSHSINHNLEFLKTLIPVSNSLEFDEGDCIPLDSDDRWIVVSGEVKVVGLNGLQFHRKAGFVFFASLETKRKIKEVVAMRYSVVFRIPQQIFKEQVRNYLYMKNSQKIKFMKYCPFLVWNQSLAEDIAIAIDLVDNLEKDVEIYRSESQADYLYFVKEGIVLLERLGKAGNEVIRDYEKHYESTYLSEEEGLLIVRKGMIFGVDGILIKQKSTQINLLDQVSNPESEAFEQYQQQLRLKTTRIYTAKAIGKVQIYRLQKNILETYLKMSDYLKSHPEEQALTSQELDRICVQYTNLLMGSNRMAKPVEKKMFNFEVVIPEEEANEMEKKKKKVHDIKENEKKMKKVPLPKEPVEPHYNKRYFHDDEQIDIFADRKSPKRESGKSMKDLSLPNINKKHMEHLIMKQVMSKEGKKVVKHKFDSVVSKQLNTNTNIAPKAKKNPESLQCMKIKSYRSLLSSLS